MNSVSWFLYFVQFISNLSVITLIALIILGIGLSLTLVFAAIEQELSYNDWPSNPLWKISRNLAIALGIFTFIALFLPSKDTMYAIAASQVGEQIIQLEEVQEVGGEVGAIAKDAITLLRQNIQEQLTEERGETSSKPVQAD